MKNPFKSYSNREVNKIQNKYINKINALEKTYTELSDKQLSKKTVEFKERLANGELLDNLLPEAFAVCREVSIRVLNMRPFDVQLIGGIILHQGRIAEMKTGEGKTLVATLPIYLNALTGDGVFLVTVNDYLATRDYQELKPFYDFLGITSSVITSTMSNELKKELYKSDIVYITNTELGFDYLRDNMIMDISKKMQREFNFAIIDEVDSILIDESKTPLIISMELNTPTQLYSMTDVFSKSLVKGTEFKIDEKENVVVLTELGVNKVETVFGLNNYADPEHNELRQYINQSLHANFCMKKDLDYIVKSNQILIIDEYTGRISEGKRYSRGLHQAIEAKENVEIKKDNETLASITYQNFFRMFKKLSGMTGTAETEQKEFNETYSLDVIVIPTNKPIIRKDKEDKLYMSEKAKINGILKDISKNYKKGRPILIGTPSIQKSEELSNELNKLNIPHNLLNAKQHEKEAEIIAMAGKKNAVTIATNMAGRGTDIKLGDGVRELGGLKVIGTERADNRRIDNQLRGRSGRQGDPGVSQFYTSFDDKLIKFATEQYKEILTRINISDTKPVRNKLLSKIVNDCQKYIESSNFDSRKNTLSFDDIINKQREIIYTERYHILETIDLKGIVYNMVETVFTELIKTVPTEKLLNELEPKYFNSDIIKIIDVNNDDLLSFIIVIAKDIIENKKKLLTEDFNSIYRNMILKVIDLKWSTQLNDLELLKRDVKMLSYRRIDPIQEYTIQSYKLFNHLILDIQQTIVSDILKSEIYKHK